MSSGHGLAEGQCRDQLRPGYSDRHVPTRSPLSAFPVYNLYSVMYLRGLSQARRCIWILNRSHAKKPPTLSHCRAASTSTPPASGAGSDDEHHAYCKDFVQKHDYEAYLVSQLYPTDKRKGYFAIKAFYVCPLTDFSWLLCLMNQP